MLLEKAFEMTAQVNLDFPLVPFYCRYTWVENELVGLTFSVLPCFTSQNSGFYSFWVQSRM